MLEWLPSWALPMGWGLFVGFASAEMWHTRKENQRLDEEINAMGNAIVLLSLFRGVMPVAQKYAPDDAVEAALDESTTSAVEDLLQFGDPENLPTDLIRMEPMGNGDYEVYVGLPEVDDDNDIDYERYGGDL